MRVELLYISNVNTNLVICCDGNYQKMSSAFVSLVCFAAVVPPDSIIQCQPHFLSTIKHMQSVEILPCLYSVL